MKYLFIAILALTFISCGEDKNSAVCGNGKVEAGEECDVKRDDCNNCKIVAVCGNGKIEAGEECDPVLSDDCNDDCKIEVEKAVCGNGRNEKGEDCDFKVDKNCDNNCKWTVEQPNHGGHLDEIISFSRYGSQFCSGTNNRDIIEVNICAVRYLDSEGNGKTTAYVREKIDAAQIIYDRVKSGIKFKLIQIRPVKMGSLYTNPQVLDDIHNIFKDSKARFAGYDCGLFISFNNSLAYTKSDGSISKAAGLSTTPWHPESTVHANIISQGSGFVVAHEIGHLFGLKHTFEEDHCSDTSVDNYKSKNGAYATCYYEYFDKPKDRMSCREYAACIGTAETITHNTMSYYGCAGNRVWNDAFTEEQINRARCYINSMGIGHLVTTPDPCASNPCASSEVCKWDSTVSTGYKCVDISDPCFTKPCENMNGICNIDTTSPKGFSCSCGEYRKWDDTTKKCELIPHGCKKSEKWDGTQCIKKGCEDNHCGQNTHCKVDTTSPDGYACLCNDNFEPNGSNCICNTSKGNTLSTDGTKCFLPCKNECSQANTEKKCKGRSIMICKDRGDGCLEYERERKCPGPEFTCSETEEDGYTCVKVSDAGVGNCTPTSLTNSSSNFLFLILLFFISIILMRKKNNLE